MAMTMTVTSPGTIADEDYTYVEEAAEGGDSGGDVERNGEEVKDDETLRSPVPTQHDPEEGGEEGEGTQENTPTSTVSSLGSREAGAFQSPSPSLMSIDENVPTPLSISIINHHITATGVASTATLHLSTSSTATMLDVNDSPSQTLAVPPSSDADMMSMSSASPDLLLMYQEHHHDQAR